MKRNRTKKMFKNVILFFLASFGTKFLSFFLVPLYTSLLTTEEYGMADYLNTIVSLILPILMLDISDSVMYFSIQADKKEEKWQILKFSMNILKISSLILFVVLMILNMSKYDLFNFKYCAYIFLYYIGNAYYLNVLAYMRASDLVNEIVKTSIITSSVTLVLNVVFILKLRYGVYGLLISSVIGMMCGNFYCGIKVNYFKISKTEFTLAKETKIKMLRYSVPLIFAGLAWWVNGSLDRFFITYFYGVGLNGIYAVANKIPAILNAVHSVVYQAMQISVFSEIKSEDGNEYVQKMYEIYNFFMVIVCSVIICLDKPLSGILFKGEFFEAWKYVPALLISTVLFSVSGYITILAAVSENTGTIASSTVLGAIVNASLNYILIPKTGLFGAVIATIVGYFCVWLGLIVKAEKALKIKLSKGKSVSMYLILIIQWGFLLWDKHIISSGCILITLIILINMNVVKIFFKIGFEMLKKVKKIF